MSVHISGTSPMSNFSCWVIVLESAFIICKSIKVSLMQTNDPSPHAVFVLQAATPWAFDLWLHVSIEVISIHYFHDCNCSSCFVQFRHRGFSEFCNWNFIIHFPMLILFHYVWQEGRQVSLSGHVIDFALHEFIFIFTAGHCIPAVARVNHCCIDAWLKLLSSTW